MAEIAELLIGKSLERCGVEDLLAMGQGSVNRVFAYEGLT